MITALESAHLCLRNSNLGRASARLLCSSQLKRAHLKFVTNPITYQPTKSTLVNIPFDRFLAIVEDAHDYQFVIYDFVGDNEGKTCHLYLSKAIA